MTGPFEHRFGWARSAHGVGPGSGDQIDVGRLARAARRQVPIVVFFSTLGAVLAVAAILGSVPKFRAVETVLLDEERADLLNDVSPMPSIAQSNSAVQSEMEIIKSQALALAVVDRLGLDENEAFLNPPVGATAAFMETLDSLADPLREALSPEPEPAPGTADAGGGGGAPAADDGTGETDRTRAAARLRMGLSVSRVGSSFVINIGYESFDPALAQDIARAYGLEYKTFQLRSTSELASNAGEWIQQRLKVLERQSLEAAAAVQEFRAENDLVQVRGNLLTEQQQSDLAGELIQAAAASAEAAARLENLEALTARAEEGNAVVVPPSTAQTREVFEELRREMVDVRRRYNRVAEQFGEDHPEAVQLRRTMESLSDAMREEIAIATESARSELDIALSRERALRENLEAATSTSGEDVAVLGRLRQLEAISSTYDAVYRDYLERYEVTTQQQGFPIASVQILSPAELPKGATSPQKKKMLASGIFLGALLGMTIGALREIRRKPLRNASEVSEELGLPCAGLVPRNVRTWWTDRKERVLRRTLARLKQACDEHARPGRPVVVGMAQISGSDPGPRFMRAFIDVLSDYGTTPVCVIDAGGADPALGRTFAQDPCVHVVSGREEGQLRARVERATDPIEEPGESAGENERGRAEYLVVLLPPLTESGPLNGAAKLLDLSILRIPWGRVTPRLVADALADYPEFRSRLSTTVLEGADLRIARRHMQPGSYEERVLYA